MWVDSETRTQEASPISIRPVNYLSATTRSETHPGECPGARQRLRDGAKLPQIGSASRAQPGSAELQPHCRSVGLGMTCHAAMVNNTFHEQESHGMRVEKRKHECSSVILSASTRRLNV